MNFDILTLKVEGVGVCGKYLLPCCCIRDSLLFDMQYDHVLKKLNFDPTNRAWVGDGEGEQRSVGKILASMLLHLLFP